MARVLVADDSPVARRRIGAALHARGVEVVEADSAQAALAIDPAGLSCALLDLDLGDGNGADVAEALRFKRNDLAVAFFSGGATEALEARARALGPWFEKTEDLERAVAWALEWAPPSQKT
jgi:CheY-like chemotaxis protein